jgi:hypothetical protein
MHPLERVLPRAYRLMSWQLRRPMTPSDMHGLHLETVHVPSNPVHCNYEVMVSSLLWYTGGQVVLLKIYKEYTDSAFNLWKASGKQTVGDYFSDGPGVKEAIKKFQVDMKEVRVKLWSMDLRLPTNVIMCHNVLTYIQEDLLSRNEQTFCHFDLRGI